MIQSNRYGMETAKTICHLRDLLDSIEPIRNGNGLCCFLDFGLYDSIEPIRNGNLRRFPGRSLSRDSIEPIRNGNRRFPRSSRSIVGFNRTDTEWKPVREASEVRRDLGFNRTDTEWKHYQALFQFLLQIQSNRYGMETKVNIIVPIPKTDSIEPIRNGNTLRIYVVARYPDSIEPIRNGNPIGIILAGICRFNRTDTEWKQRPSVRFTVLVPIQSNRYGMETYQTDEYSLALGIQSNRYGMETPTSLGGRRRRDSIEPIRNGNVDSAPLSRGRRQDSIEPIRNGNATRVFHSPWRTIQSNRYGMETHQKSIPDVGQVDSIEPIRNGNGRVVPCLMSRKDSIEPIRNGNAHSRGALHSMPDSIEPIRNGNLVHGLFPW